MGADGVQRCYLYGKSMKRHGGLGGPGYEQGNSDLGTWM